MKYISLIIICLLIISSCQESKTGRKYKANEFTYKISYLIGVDQKPVVALLPEKMTIYHTKNHIYYKTEGWMGFFNSIQIINISDSTRTLLAKFMDKKYAHIQSLNDEPLKFENFNNLLINDNANNVQFKGFNAIECNFQLSKDVNDEQKIVYTNHFNIDNPNIGTPFCKINGILLNYTMSTMGIPMLVEFIGNKDTLISDSMFTISEDYQILDREEFEAVFEEYSPK